MNHRVLVVDDEPQVRVAMERALRHVGYDVLTASSGESAYAMLAEERVDGVLLDLSMPQLSGDAVFLAIVRRWPELADRVILMSGYPDPLQDHWPAELRACRTLEKPFSLDELYRVVSEVVKRPGGERRRSHG